MPSNYTQNYQLSQWEADDQVCRTDFNADNAKIDVAMAGFTTALAQKGNCQITSGSYTGTGTFGASSPKSLSFPFKPLLVAISCKQDPCILVAGTETYLQSIWMESVTWKVSWSGNSVSWYVRSVSHFDGGIYNTSAEAQFNEKGAIYHYVAIGAVDN